MVDREWQYFPYEGEGVVFFHPFRGELHVLSAAAEKVIDLLKQRRDGYEAATDIFAETATEQEREELGMMIDSLCEIGVLRRCPNSYELPS